MDGYLNSGVYRFEVDGVDGTFVRRFPFTWGRGRGLYCSCPYFGGQQQHRELLALGNDGMTQSGTEAKRCGRGQR